LDLFLICFDVLDYLQFEFDASLNMKITVVRDVTPCTF